MCDNSLLFLHRRDIIKRNKVGERVYWIILSMHNVHDLFWYLSMPVTCHETHHWHRKHITANAALIKFFHNRLTYSIRIYFPTKICPTIQIETCSQWQYIVSSKKVRINGFPFIFCTILKLNNFFAQNQNSRTQPFVLWTITQMEHMFLEHWNKRSL